MNLDRRTFQIPEDQQRQFQIFLVHLKSFVSHAMDNLSLWNQSTDSSKTPLDVSSCHLQRAPEPLAFQPLGDYQAHLPNPHYRIKLNVQEK